jgi:acyl-CoA-binding protein
MSQEEFESAVKYVQEGPPIEEITNELKLRFYGLFKQASTGPCNESAPSRLKVVQRMKWDAWNKLGKMSKEEARKEYIKQLTGLSAKWKEWKGGKAKL